jgi:hypothetical protein
MKYAAEMGSAAMICILSFTKIGSGIQMLIGGTHRHHGDLISLLLFFQSKESRLKMDLKWDVRIGLNSPDPG